MMSLWGVRQGPAWRGRAASGWSDRLIGWLRRSAAAWPLAALAALVVLVINETSHEHSMRALARLEQRSAAILDLQVVLRRLLDAETGQRGYLLTGRKVYLAPSEQAAADAFAGLDRLRHHYADDAPAQQRLGELRAHAQARLDELADTVQAFEAEQRARLNALLATDTRYHMDQVRRLGAELGRIEQQQVALEREAVFQTLRISRIGVDVSAALGLLALLLVLRQTAALAGMRERHAQALRQEQARLEAEVAQRSTDLTELARHLHGVREDESERLARHLQDELGALLAATRGEVLRLRRQLGDAAAPEVRARLDHLAASIDGGISLKRRIVEDLRPSSLNRLGLVAALENQAREFAERSGLAVHTELEAVALGDSAQITLYRLVQEALTNVAKYARASGVTLALRSDAGHARISVHDDGCGFDPAAAPRGAHGLIGMRYRVEAAGGRLHIRSAPGQGTRIEAVLPLPSLAALS
jgi:signal transduction histidine kinase